MEFIPEQNQSFIALGNISLGKKLSDLNTRLSPMLPLNFDKSYLPHNLCQTQYIKLVECYLFGFDHGSTRCSYHISKFQRCRQNRDIQILDGIKRWQIKHINGLQKSNRILYLQGLTFKLDRLKKQYSKIPSTTSKQMKMAEIDNQIETIKWRMNYIKKNI